MLGTLEAWAAKEWRGASTCSTDKCIYSASRLLADFLSSLQVGPEVGKILKLVGEDCPIRHLSRPPCNVYNMVWMRD